MMKRGKYSCLKFVMIAQDPTELPLMVTSHLDIVICGPGVSRQALNRSFKLMVVNGDPANFIQAYDSSEDVILHNNGFSKL